MTDTLAHLAADTHSDTALCGVTEWTIAFVLIAQSPLEIKAPADTSGWCNVCVGRWIVQTFNAGGELLPHAARSLAALHSAMDILDCYDALAEGAE